MALGAVSGEIPRCIVAVVDGVYAALAVQAVAGWVGMVAVEGGKAE